jgi:hypothetical protein
MRPAHLFLLSVLAFGAVLFSINDVSATGTGFPVAADTLQMVCSIPGIGEGSIATVTAGNGTPGPTFPVIVTCPGLNCPGGPSVAGSYARWDFTFDFTSGGYGSRTALVQVAADVTIEDTDPIATVLNPGEETLLNGILNDFDSKWIRFASVSDPFTGSYYTKPNFIPRIEGAAAKKGLVNIGKCRLAGAGSRFGDPSTPVQTFRESEILGCQIREGLDGRGCTTSLTVLSGDCGTIENAAALLDGVAAQGLNSGTKCENVHLQFNGSCKVCSIKANGALSCVTRLTGC